MEPDASDLAAAKVLIVDDNPTNLKVLLQLLGPAGYSILVASNGESALKNAFRAQPELILLDVMMPEMDGYEVCRRLKANAATREIPVIFITANDQTEGLVAGFDAGGVDYIAKPFRGEEVLMRMQTHLRINRLSRELAQKNRELEEEMAQRRTLTRQLSMISDREAREWGLEEFVAQSPTMQRIAADMHTMQEQVGSSVLITGEDGTGKELVARSIHYGSARRDKAFVPVDCTDIPEDVVQSLEHRTQALSTLFGHVQGAFAGADTDQEGCFQMAHAGTLFFDEIGRIPLPLQSHLLRVLESGEVRRVGEQTGRAVDVRVLAATSLDLGERLQAGTFRRDLYEFLTQFAVVVPPLRQRPEDLPVLARHFLKLVVKEGDREPPALSTEALALLEAYAFPGNVRELKNIIERALLGSNGRDIEPRHLRFLVETASPNVDGIGRNRPFTQA